MGTHPEFFERMLGGLRKEAVITGDGQKYRPLETLRTRDKDDPFIALVDAWAMTLDVLTFYQERIVNEGYLRTATERRSVMELARTVGYELSPGMASAAYLAFIVNDAPGSPREVRIPAGTKVMSVPKHRDAMPLIFETEKAFTARLEWNDIKPAKIESVPASIHVIADEDGDGGVSGDGDDFALRDQLELTPEQQAVSQADSGIASFQSPDFSDNADKTGRGRTSQPSTASLRIKGVNSGLRKGDVVLVRGGGRRSGWYIGIVLDAESKHEKDHTLVRWMVPPGKSAVPSNPQIYALRKRASLFGHNAADWNELSNKKKLGYMLNTDVKAVAIHNGVLFAGVSRGRIFRNTGGAEWKEAANLNIPSAITSLASGRDGKFAAGTAGHGVFISGDNGNSWNEFNDGLTNLNVESLKYDELGSLFAETASGKFNCFSAEAIEAMKKAAEAKQISEDFKETSEYEQTWRDAGSGAKMNGSFYKPKLEDGYVCLGHVATGSHEEPKFSVLIAKADSSFIAKPSGYEKIWDDGGSGADDDFSCWKPIPPQGYRAIGLATVGSHDKKPSSDAVYCVKESLTTEASVGSLIWNDSGSGADKNFSAWSVGSNGFFAAHASHSKLSGTFYQKIESAESDTSAQIPESSGTWTKEGESQGDSGSSGQDADSIEKLLAGHLLDDWYNYKIKDKKFLDFDSDYSDIVAGSYAVLIRDGVEPVLTYIKRVSTVFRRNYGVSGKVTRIEINADSDFNPDIFNLRDTVLYAKSEHLEPDTTDPSVKDAAASKYTLTEKALEELSDIPNIEKLRDREFDESILDSADFTANKDRILNYAEKTVIRLSFDKKLGLTPGQAIAFTGNNIKNEKIGEIAIVQKVIEDEEQTLLEFEEPLKNDYVYGTLSINANVVLATHGETIDNEVLGSGDATVTNQRFMLKRKPLTYIIAEKSTLEIWVNGVRWNETASLYDSDENSKTYMVRIDESGNAVVIFGDGKHGARLPSGEENITATYRIGLGSEDMPEANSLILLTAPPLGILKVSNPVPATGGADPENHEQTRIRLPLIEAPHDRIVSLGDYENFAATFPGVAKAQATRFRVKNRFLVHITLAGEKGREIPNNSKIAQTLFDAIKNRHIYGQAVKLQSYKPLRFGLEADIFFDTNHREEKVEERVRAALLDAFSFENQKFGQKVTKSDAVPVIQNTPGVVYVVFKGFIMEHQKEARSLEALKAHWDYEKDKVLPAEMLLIDPEKMLLNIKK
ncbi:CHP02243 [Desulfonema magnum]|uniref:CHP02243 n=1 Tax=Desulfonema magnum TaxID=45655 RepID=A0A975BPK3_9BACT|nr:CHP02243 [Desulfonema magnum]